jgi:two-component system cell cycle sensor histidine kinase/response regulator CckA
MKNPGGCLNLPSSVESLFPNLDKLEDPLAMLKAMAIHATVGIQIYDARGYTLFCNPQFAKIFGAPPPPGYCVLEDEQAKAAGILDLMHRVFAGEQLSLPLTWYDPRELKNLSPEETEYLRKYCQKAAIETRCVPVLGKDGKVTHVIFIFKDVTAELQTQEQQQQALKERDDAKLQFQSLLENTRAVVYIKDLEGKYLFANEQFCKIFDKTSAHILGRKDHDLFPAELADKFRENDFQVLSCKTHLEVEEIAVHGDGVAHTYISLKFPLNDSTGAPYGLCGISTDITQYRKMERELSTAKRMEAVGLLAGGIAHDFNNILAIILMVADTLTMSESTAKPDLDKMMAIVKDAGQRAAALTRSLLAFGRRQKLQPRLLALGTNIRDIENILNKALGEDVQFTVNVASDLWLINAHPTQIDQILTNLAFNSRDAMPKGGNLTITAVNVSIIAGQGGWKIGNVSGDFVELQVADTGCGIDPKILDRIYEPFFTTKQEGQRSGLGLSTVYGIVQDIGGEILVESSPGQGATFKIYFPRARGTIAPSIAKPAPANKTPRSTETILLVEDQEVLRGITATFLRERGYIVYEASDGTSALQLWSKISSAVDLVMTDIVMPGMSGLEMTQTLLKTGAKPHMKVLFVSGYSEKKLSEYGFDRDKYQVFEKPYGASALLSKIREIFES